MQDNNQEPIKVVELAGAEVTLLGTAHVSHTSEAAVRELLSENQFDAVAVELCPSRYNALIEPDDLARMDLMQVIREGRASMVAANLALGAYQQRLADQFGIEPGAEQKTAIRLAREQGLPVLLIDREIGITLKRTARNLSWFRRWGLFAGLMASLVTSEKVEEDEIEKLKEGDILENTFAEFAEDREDLYEPLIHERDRYMAARILQETQTHQPEKVLAVVGAGHLKGISQYLSSGLGQPDEVVAELDKEPVKSKWPKLIPWVIVALVLVGFVIGFLRSPSLGWQLVIDWVVLNGGLSALGALIATAHPLTIVTAFLAAPLTSLNPTIGAGMVTAAAEIFLRKPQVGDFSKLKSSTTSIAGWWKNRVSRTLLVFLFSTLGSAVGTYLAGFRIFERLTN